MFPWDKPDGGTNLSKGARVHSAQWIQNNMHQRRKKESEIEKIQSSLAAQSLSVLKANGEQKLASRRLSNNSIRATAEQVLQDTLISETIDKEKKLRTVKQDEIIAKELERQHLEEEMRKREIQRICEEDESLRELQEKLKAAYMNKERTAQIKEKEAIKVIEKEKTRQFDELDEYYRRMSLQEEVNKKSSKMKESLKTRDVLMNQMFEKEKAIQEEAHAQWLRDKEQVDAIVQKINKEDEMEESEKKRKQYETKLYIDQFQKERTAFLARQKYEREQEEAHISRYAEEKRKREADIVARKAADLAYQDGLYAKLKEVAEEKMKQVKEMEEFREILQTEENEERLRKDSERRKNKHEKSVKEMMEANELQKKLKEEQRVKAAYEENILVQKMRAKFDADETREKLAAKMREDAKKAYKKGVEAQRQQLREMYEAEVRAEAAERDLEAQKIIFRERVVEEARKRMLEEHASLLKGHLPKGVLKSSDDLNYLSSNTFLT